MATVILETEEYSRSVLVSLLNKIDYGPVYAATTVKKADYFIKRYETQIKLIVLACSRHDDIAGLLRNISQNAQLCLAPVIIINDGKLEYKSERIDGSLKRPFGVAQLRKSIQQAHLHRARHRDVLLVLSQNLDLRRPVADSHWQTVLVAESPEAFRRMALEHKSRIGAIVVDPRLSDPSFQTWINQFKKSALGSITPVAILSQAPSEIRPFRLTCDLFLNDWESVSVSLSRRTLQSWSARRVIIEGRKFIKQGLLDQSAILVQAGLQDDPRRWEFHEMAGLLAAQRGSKTIAIQHFRRALSENPCTPSSYLKLLDLTEGDERRDVLQNGAAYCPAHPQLRDILRASA